MSEESSSSNSSSSEEAPGSRRPRGRRKRWWVLGGIALLLLVAWLAVSWIVTPLVRGKLESMVAKQFNARLVMEDFSYEFPYGVKARNVAIVAKDARGEDVTVFHVRGLKLALAELPWGEGPLLIEKIVVDQPTLNMVREEGEFVGLKKLAQGENRDDSAIGGVERPSDHFRLRHFEIKDGEVAYERRGKGGDPDGETLVVWNDINVSVDLTPYDGAIYRFEVSGQNAPVMTAEVRGKIDVDERTVEIEKYAVAVKAQKDADYAGLTSMVGRVLESNEVEGTLTMSGKALVPLKDPLAATHESMIELPRGRARLKDLKGTLDNVSLRMRVSHRISDADLETIDAPIGVGGRVPMLASTSGGERNLTTLPSTSATTRPMKMPPLSVVVENFRADSGKSWIQVRQAKALADPETGFWRLKEVDAQVELAEDRRSLPAPLEKALGKLGLAGKLRLTAAARGPLARADSAARIADLIEYQAIASARDVTIQPPRFPRPISGLAGTLRAGNKALVLENVEGQYGDDRYFLTSARIPLDDVANLDRELRVREINGWMQLRGLTEDYPKPFEWTARNLRPAGRWYVAGDVGVLRDEFGTSVDYKFDVHSDEAAGALTKSRIPLTDARCRISAVPGKIEIKRIEGNSLGGRLTVEGVVVPGRPLAYDITGWARDVDVKALATLLSKDRNPPKRVSGKGNVNVHAWGWGKHHERSADEFFNADGRFEILEGEFWDAPVVDAVVKGTQRPQEALTAGEAAGAFDIRDRRVHLKRIAVSSPMLGLQGDGWIGFDKRADLRVVAAPLADWKDQMKRTNIPFVSDVAGEVLGAFQQVLNAASKTLLYEFRVTGAINDPRVVAVPAPVLTDSVAMLFNSMIKGKRLREAVEEEQSRGKAPQ